MRTAEKHNTLFAESHDESDSIEELAEMNFFAAAIISAPTILDNGRQLIFPKLLICHAGEVCTEEVSLTVLHTFSLHLQFAPEDFTEHSCQW